MTEEELLELYIKQITNYDKTYEEFKTVVVEQDPDFPGLAEFLNEDLYSYEEFLNKPEPEEENDNSTNEPTEANSSYW